MNKKVIFVFVAAGILLILGGALVLWQLVFTVILLLISVSDQY